MKLQSEPKILIYDIETGMGFARVPFYQLKQYSPYINPDYIETDVWMVCASWKWLGKKPVHSVSVLDDKERFKDNFRDDYHVTKALHEVLSEADIILAHNGDNFDWKIIMARCAFHGLPPPPRPLMVDTLKIARKEFKFSSNALRYLATFLGVEDKGKSPKWAKIAEGDVKEIKYCAKYNKQDVVTLEGIYEKLKPFASNHPNLNAITRGIEHHTCPKCLHWGQEARGYRYTKAGKYQRYQCNPKTGGCGGWSSSGQNLKKVGLK